MPVLSKNIVARGARDACLEGLDGFDRATRKSANNAVVAYPDGFVVFDVQFNLYPNSQSHHFCINFGLLPRCLFDANWTGWCKQVPDLRSCLFHGRIGGDGFSDRWWLVADERRLSGAAVEIQTAVRVLKQNDYWKGYEPTSALNFLKNGEGFGCLLTERPEATVPILEKFCFG
jgi:hypothetical protein